MEYSSASKKNVKKALDGFRSGKIQLLVASDIAARGLDVKDVTHIFNLDLPEDSKEYLHRAGRNG
jgi:superfamily II DNA/RNA helicase